MSVADDFRITCERDAADDALLLDELEGRAQDQLDAERRDWDMWGPSHDDMDLEPLPRDRYERYGQ